MDHTAFENRLRSIVLPNEFYTHAHLLPTILPEKRLLFITAVECGYSLSETIQLHANDRLQPETVWNAMQQKMQDGTSEIQA